MVIYPTFQLTTFEFRIRFHDVSFRPVEKEAIGEFCEEFVTLDIGRNVGFSTSDDLWNWLSDTESWTNQVARLLDSRGGRDAWIPARRDICYTRNPAIIAEELNRYSYKLNFQVTPGLVIAAQKLKRQRGAA